jgi:hypothetical protein
MRVNTVLDAIKTTLEAELPAEVAALSLPAIKAVQRGRISPSKATSCPYVAVFAADWDQPVDTENRTIGGVGSAHVNRKQAFNVVAVVAGSDESEVDERLMDYADALTAVLETHYTFGLSNVNSDVTAGGYTSAEQFIPGGGLHFRQGGVMVVVNYQRILGVV